MGLDVGGYHDRPDWPKMGPSLLIATRLIVAIRTAKWPARSDAKLFDQEMNDEIEFAAYTASRGISHGPDCRSRSAQPTTGHLLPRHNP